MKQLRDEGATGFEVEVLFRQILNMNQIHYISRMLSAIGKYIVLDRDMLNVRTGGKIGLSFVKKAIDYKLVAEHQYKSQEEGSKNTYFLSLAPGGLYFLQAQGYLLNQLPLDADHHVRSRILTYNQFLIDKNQDISIEYKQGNRSDLFFSKAADEPRTLVHYFPYLIAEKQVQEFLKRIIEKELQSNKSVEGSDSVPEDIDVDAMVDERFLLVQIKGQKVAVGDLSFCRDEKTRKEEFYNNGVFE